jgi:hypothetical protein
MRDERPATRGLVVAAVVLVVVGGCRSLGPRMLEETRVPYNEAVKTTTEEQLLLNIVRLRYTDTPSSLAISNIAAQFEMVKSLQLTPFFTATGGDHNRGSYGAVLPQAALGGADRPTFSFTPLDDQEFTKKLFTPLSLDGIIYLVKTTWPISTVFRLYLENLNWVSNAETASGPTPKDPPVYEEFLKGIQALQTLQDRDQIVFGLDERAEAVGGPIPAASVKPADVIEAAKNGLDYQPDEGGATWTLRRKVQQPVLRIDPEALDSAEMKELARVFKVKLGVDTYDVTFEALNPFPSTYPKEGVTKLDLETRSLLQAMYYISHGVEIPPDHSARGILTVTRDANGRAFDWQQVMKGLFRVGWAPPGERPKSAHVAVQYEGNWYYIDDRDQDTKATFSLLMELARLELSATGAQPLLTIPLGGR